jgi:N-glycosylase/DNA lyase
VPISSALPRARVKLAGGLQALPRMEFALALASPFSLDYTLESGQLFRWTRKGESWYGVVGGSVLRVRQEGEVLRCSSGSDQLDSDFVTKYFRLDDDLEHILASLTKDDVITRAIQKLYGLRLARQDRWECLASFVLATNANIPRISKMVSSICERYGKELEFEGEKYYDFPDAVTLSESSLSDLNSCGLGYRSAFLKRVATAVAGGRIDLSSFDSMSYEEARKVLLKELLGEKILLGVGPKVADCVLLYSCGKDAAFPIDVWIAKVLAGSYPKMLGQALRRKYARDGKVKLSPGDYDRISQRVRSYFGPYAGYAQQYLFMAAREELV